MSGFLLDTELQARFSSRILPIDAPVADRWGVLAAQAKIKGVRLPIIDGLLAATAIHTTLLWYPESKRLHERAGLGIESLRSVIALYPSRYFRA